MLVGLRDPPLVIGDSKTQQFSLPVFPVQERNGRHVHLKEVVMATRVLQCSCVVVCEEEMDRIWVSVTTNSIHQLQSMYGNRERHEWHHEWCCEWLYACMYVLTHR